MMGHVVLHRIMGGVAVVLGKHSLEVGFGHGMPAVEVGPFEDLEVTEQFTESFLACVIESMVGTREPDKIRGSVVEGDTVEVVALERTTLFVGLLFANPCECDCVSEVDATEVYHLEVTLHAIAVESVARACIHRRHLQAVDGFVTAMHVVAQEDVGVRRTIEGGVQGSVAGAFHVRHAANFGSIR